MTAEGATIVTLLCVGLGLAIPVAYWFGQIMEGIRRDDAEPDLEPGAVVRIGGVDYVLLSVHQDMIDPETQVVLRDRASHERLQREGAR